MNDYKKYAQVVLDGYDQKKTPEDFERFFENFINLLKSKKQLQLLPKIYQEIKKLLETKKNQDKTILIVSDKDKLDLLKEQISKYTDSFDLDNIEIQEEKNIIGGFILKNKKFITDNSYKKKLLDLYKKLVA